MISLNKLQHFVALARSGSYVRTAEEVHLSQPALSRSIQSLELYYGVTLFDRGRSGVVLTRVGEEILAQAEALLHNARSLGDYLTKSSAGLRGKVSLSMGPQLADQILSPLTQTIVTRYPQARLSVGMGSVAAMRTQLLAGQIDFFVGHYDRNLVHDRIDIIHLSEGSPTFLVRPDHPLLSTDEDEIPPEALLDYPKVCGTAWNETLSTWRDRNLSECLKASIEIDNLQIVIDVARRTDAVLIGSLGRRVTDLVPLNVRLPDGRQGTAIGIHRLADRTLSPLTESVIRTVEELTRHA